MTQAVPRTRAGCVVVPRHGRSSGIDACQEASRRVRSCVMHSALLSSRPWTSTRTGSELSAAISDAPAYRLRRPGPRSRPASTVTVGVRRADERGQFWTSLVHPFPDLRCEPVLMIDREGGFELTGYDACPRTNCQHVATQDLESALTFVARRTSATWADRDGGQRRQPCRYRRSCDPSRDVDTPHRSH